MSGQTLEVLAAAWSERSNDLDFFSSSVSRRTIWPLGNVGDRSASGITGRSVFSIGGVVGHFGGAGRLPVFVGDGEYVMESRSTAESGVSGRSAEKGTRAGSAGIGPDASAEGEDSKRAGRARRARRARRGTQAEVGGEGRVGVHVALAARHAVGGLPMAGWKCRFSLSRPKKLSRARPLEGWSPERRGRRSCRDSERRIVVGGALARAHNITSYWPLRLMRADSVGCGCWDNTEQHNGQNPMRMDKVFALVCDQ